MGIRTDLAIEFTADKTENLESVVVKKYEVKNIRVTNVEILNEQAAKELGKPVGRYVTLESAGGVNIFDIEMLREILIAEIRGLIGRVEGNVLVVGVGNTTITPDALGPKAASRVMATRHIDKKLAGKLGMDHLRSVSVICPGVLAQTGIESKDIIASAIERTNPEAVVIIDALAAREVSRLGRTVQLSNTGLAPGSGVGNARTELTERTLGVKCVTVGVPTVVDASTLCYDLTGTMKREHEPLIVTPRDIDRLIEKSCRTIGYCVNIALQPDVDPEVLTHCV